ncbi:DeoR/GlpR family DNA-binding transcription regulator [Microbacterium thalli]|uniref:Lactose phosphotransferase system repressor n=1 Tax=Microbacterium thalli TaxID=3027921 RepID=A0ABT5SLH5_9MICO|nr:DeoR/GlpR family DNA-binding transcription regulator [Microbacterium thalli]MDD7962673.1 DeoR/GlpR family DNA-binding transcription regulator [Microbacterium thalli]MDN8547676.1 DeoR/GlpR family DNA-binding transcription regulator [Microbacterium thalli]
MYATERQQLIERMLADDGRVAVVDLAARFDVTTETVRRDLAALEEAGALRRVHGGAVSPERTSTAEPSVAERSLRRSEAKERIARRALAALPTGAGSIYLDAGTTTAALAAALVARTSPSGCEVVTHSMTIAHSLAGVSGIGLTAIGGRVRGLTAAAVGSDTVAAIGRLRPDVAFLGANGIAVVAGLTTPDPEEAAVKRAVVAGARRVIVLADADKFEAELLVSFADLSDLDVVVTDRDPGTALSRALRDADVEVWIA